MKGLFVTILFASALAFVPQERLNAATFAVTFPDLNTIILGGVLLGTGDEEPLNLDMTNGVNSGLNWTDFHLQITQAHFKSGTYSGPGNSVISNTGSGFTATGTLDIFQLNVIPGNTLSFSVTALGTSNMAPGSGLSATPTVVPVPAAVWLFGTAFAGLIGASRARKVA